MFLWQQHRWKEHMMKEIKQHPASIDAQEMYFADAEFSELSWHEGKKEFVHQGEYYDVIHIKTVRGGKVIKCLRDKDESKLVARYVESGKGKPNPFQQLLKLSWLKIVMEPQEPMHNSAILFSQLHEKHLFNYEFSVQETTIKTLSPPPNFG